MLDTGRATAQSQLEAYQVEMLGGIETLKSMGATDRAYARWSGLYVDALNRSIVPWRWTVVRPHGHGS